MALIILFAVIGICVVAFSIGIKEMSAQTVRIASAGFERSQ